MSRAITSRKAWGLADPNGSVWFESFANKQRAMSFAVQRCIGAGEYAGLMNDSDRWKLAYRRGFRIVPVCVTANRKAAGK